MSRRRPDPVPASSFYRGPIGTPIVGNPTSHLLQRLTMERFTEERAWESFVRGQMALHGENRRRVGRRLRKASFVAGFRAGKASTR